MNTYTAAAEYRTSIINRFLHTHAHSEIGKDIKLKINIKTIDEYEFY